MIVQFFIVFKDYLIEVLPFLVIGLLLSGIVHEFVSEGWVEKHLGEKGIKPLFYATLFGTLLPICCIGSLPVAVSLHQKGARLGPVLAFLVATPATSITALLVCYGLLGIKFTVYIFLAVIVMGLLMGLVGNRLKVNPKLAASQSEPTAVDPVCGMSVEVAKAVKTEYRGDTYYFCCPHCRQAFESSPEEYLEGHSRNIGHRLKHVFRYAFVDMVKDIGPEMILGLVLAALVATITPIGEFIGDYFDGGWGYAFSLVFGMIMYICSTASVPLVHAFLAQGMNSGAGMVLLLAGPVTSWSTMLVLRKKFGGTTLLVYLLLIGIVSLALGYLFNIIS